MPALAPTSAWQSRVLAANELWQCWEGILEVDTEAVEANRRGIRLYGGDSRNCAVTLKSGDTVYYRAPNGPCVAGYIPQP